MNRTPLPQSIRLDSANASGDLPAPARLNRRRFLTRASATGALAGLALAGIRPACAAAAGSAPAPAAPRWKISVLSYSFRGLLNAGKMDVFGYLDACKHRYQLRAADIWNGFLPTVEESFIRKVRAALDDRGLALADLCVDKAHVWDDDPAVRQSNYENAKAHLRAAEILGAGFMRVDAGSRAATWTKEQFDFIVGRYREYAQFAHDHGFKMGAENHWGPETSWPNLQKLYRAVDHPGFGLSIHLGGWKGTDEEKIAWDREAAPLACHTHIPWNITQGPVVERLAPFYRTGYAGYYSVEHHSGENEYAEVAIQLDRVREALEKLQSTEQRERAKPSGA